MKNLKFKTFLFLTLTSFLSAPIIADCGGKRVCIAIFGQKAEGKDSYQEAIVRLDKLVSMGRGWKFGVELVSDQSDGSDDKDIDIDYLLSKGDFLNFDFYSGEEETIFGAGASFLFLDFKYDYYRDKDKNNSVPIYSRDSLYNSVAGNFSTFTTSLNLLGILSVSVTDYDKGKEQFLNLEFGGFDFFPCGVNFGIGQLKTSEDLVGSITTSCKF